jgi:ABC-type uncharacterized transport system substrate-binding protein
MCLELRDLTLLIASPALAHPHVFIDSRIEWLVKSRRPT